MAFAFSERSRLPLVVALSVVAVTAVAYAAQGAPVPRPVYLFVGVGLSLTALLFAALRVETLTRPDLLAIGGATILSGVFLRFSAFAVVVTSGVDHARWVMHVQSNIAANGITGTHMYASAPMYLLELGVAQRILGLSAFQTRFVTLAITSFLPVFIGILAHRITDDTRTGLVALIIATPHFLFLRTSVLLEAESLALIWFTTTTFLLVRFLQTDDRRYFALFGSFMLTAVFLHFLYGVVVFATVAGTLVLTYVAWSRSTPDMAVFRGQIRRLAAVTGAAGIFIPVWILASTYGGVAIDILRSFGRETSSGTTNETTTNETTPNSGGTSGSEAPSGGGRAGDSSILDAIANFVLPQSGTVARSVGTAGGSSGDTLLALFPLLLFVGGAGLGGLVAVLRRRKYDQFLLATLVTVGTMAVVSVFIDIHFSLGYRLYYFLGALLIVATSIAIRRSTAGSWSRVAAVVVVVLFVPYASMGPMSPLGNNVDPQLGGTDWRFTGGEYEQLESLDVRLDHGTVVRSDVPQVPHHLDVRSPEESAHLTRSECPWDREQILDTGGFRLCG